ncbi:Transcriptional regulatory protein RXT2 [Spathaspora sp. JA1]|nr:Transcriptional regulatory protein RXT2 [Spathaspora sp. JA1]
MLDSISIEVISRLKQALVKQEQEEQEPDQDDINNNYLSIYNRGYKLNNPFINLDSLHPKVVEYEGVQHLVLSNDVIESENTRNKRKWKEEYYRENEEGEQEEEEDEEEEESDDSDYSSEDEQHPLKKLRIQEILAPLNHPSEIITHPAISKTFKSTIFNKISSELIELIEVEQTNLNWLNKILQVLNGEDWFYLLEENIGLAEYDHGLDVDASNSANSSREAITASATADASTPKVETNGVKQTEEPPVEVLSDEDPTDPFFALPQALKRYQEFQNRQLDTNNQDKIEILKDDLINYLQVSIQRQHEYIKNLTQLRNGIVRADRLKRDLLKWGKEMHDKKSS